MKNESNQNKQEKPVKRKLTHLLVFIAICIIIIDGGYHFLSRNLDEKADNERIIVDSKSQLISVIETKNLITAEYPYSAVTTVYKDESKKTVKYYSSFEGTVKAGIEFDPDNIANNISFDDNQKTITIRLPEVKILKCYVDPGSLEYIFKNRKDDTETVPAEAYAACIEDLENRAAKEPTLLKIAEENAKSTIEGLVKPIFDPNEYTIIFE